MESFIRSKYESRRWAMEGPPPADPSVLDDSPTSPPESVLVTEMQHPAALPFSHSTPISNGSISTASTVAQSPIATRQPHPHQLLSTSVADRNQQVWSQHMQEPPTSQLHPIPLDNSLFSLDFHSSVSATTTENPSSQPKKDAKQDILSLFSTPSAPTTFGQLHVTSAQQPSWGQFNSPQPQQLAQPTIMTGTSGFRTWANPPAGQEILWGNSTQPQQSVTGTNNIWESAGNGGGLLGMSKEKADDVFGDLWGHL